VKEQLRSYVAPFVLGFASCAVVARLMLPVPVGASSGSGGAFTPVSSAEVAAAAGDSVVSIEAYSARDVAREGLVSRLLGDLSSDRPEPSVLGSGVIFSHEGYIVTNEHVVDGAARIRVRLATGKEYDATPVGIDRHSDLAVLRIRGKKLQPALLGDSRQVRPGDGVVAIGNPLGFENSVSVGVISANRKGPFRVDGRVLGDMIQTDAAINQGNSGGGLFTANGRLVGINSAIITSHGGTGNIGIGFAIPAHRVRPIVESLIARGRVPRPWLGISYQLPRVSSLNHRPSGAGVRLHEVIPGGPAAQAGLTRNDVIRRIGELPVRTVDDLYDFADRYRPGRQVPVWVFRDGEEKRYTVTLRERPS